MHYIRQHPLLSALLVNVVLFSGFFAVRFSHLPIGRRCIPAVYFERRIWTTAHEFLHYHYGLHPYLGWIIKNLFVRFPGFNWYSALLYLFHFAACTTVLALWIRKNPTAFIISCYALLFFGVEMHFLLHPTFTNAAFVSVAAGLLMLYQGYRLRSGANNANCFWDGCWCLWPRCCGCIC